MALTEGVQQEGGTSYIDAGAALCIEGASAREPL